MKNTRIHDFQDGKDRLEVDVDPNVRWQDQVSWSKIGADTVIDVHGSTTNGDIVLVSFRGTLSGSDFDFV